MRIFLYSLNFLLMLLMPVLLGWFVARRRRASWRLFLVGAATFVLAQVLHIPFNHLVSNNSASLFSRLPETATVVLNAAFLGLSAGVFEEGARYLSYRYWARDARSWGSGLMMGAGHGGAESILLGLLGALNIAILFGYQAGYFQSLIPAAQEPLVQQVLAEMVAIPWFQVLSGAMERLLALCIQLALSLIVMKAFTRGGLAWLFLAIGWHAIIDASVVLAASWSGIYAVEAIAALAAVISLCVVVRFREPEPDPPVIEPLPAAGPVGVIKIEPSKDRLENSRFM